ncbi:MAG: ABC transporter ATP-binding protein [Fibrobacteria bacterium]|nr:ABC transporter ATP-binding protein [Fibrobacteria bacterium]
MIDNVIQAQGLAKVYPGAVPVTALSHLDLEVRRGEFAAVIGPSGSGKTTLLNLLGGLDTPSSGKLLVDGQELSGLSSEKLIDFRLAHIGFVFQAYNLVPVLSALENVEFVMLLQGQPRKKREERALELLEAVGLADRRHARPGEMSGGQQQRVAVARALASRPGFVLADEPTANLDSRSAFDLLDVMKKLNEDEKTTFLFSTHDPRVMERASRVVTLEDGLVVSDERRPG